MITLRPYQTDADRNVRDAWASGSHNVLLVLPTGAGKTVVKSHITREMDLQTMCIAHRQELVAQISTSLASFGIYHNIIAPVGVVRFCVDQHIRAVGQSFYATGAKFAVAGVDTLLRRTEQNQQFISKVQLWDIDECFPAGTLVDGRPIESLVVGDSVTAFDESRNRIVKSHITRLFKRAAPQHMVRIVTSAHHVLTCTPNHPLLTRRGWIAAQGVTNDDELLHVRGTGKSESRVDENVPENETPVLQHGLQQKIPVENIVGNNESNESQICVRTHETEQSDAPREFKTQDAENIEENGTFPEDSGRKRTPPDGCGTEIARFAVADWVRNAGHRADRLRGAGGALPVALQNRLRESGAENSDRGGRSESFDTSEAGTGRTERPVSAWCGVDSISILESNNSRIAGDGYVYNIEVDQYHTYSANGIIVHNCHHVLPKNKWGRAVALFPGARGLGVTATPLRADRKGLDGIFDTMIVGPSMRDLIDQNHLSDYRIFCPPESIDLSGVETGSTGDYKAGQLAAASEKSTITGDVVSHYLKIAPGKRGLTFTVDVKSGEEVTQAYLAAGVPAAMVTAKTPDRIRASLLDDLRRGDVKQLVNVDLFGEGMDCPAIEVVSMARPTKSYGLYIQQAGRMMRVTEGKSHGILIDHVGNVIRHNLPDVQPVWSLESPKKSRAADGDAVIGLRRCVECLRPYYRNLTACPYCGHKPEPTGRKSPEQVEGNLIELNSAILAKMRGEVARIDGDPQIPVGASDPVKISVTRNWRRRQEEQKILRECMSTWAGVFRHGHGESTPEIQKRFWLRFGIDVISAQTLGAREASALAERIREDFE